MVESDIFLKEQCLKGLNLLSGAEKESLCEVIMVLSNSIYLNTNQTLANVRGISERGDIDVIIVGAGGANHLAVIVDAYLRCDLQDNKIVVIGVAFEGIRKQHDKAAALSIEHAPGSQVVFDRHTLFGPEGFEEACRLAVEGDLPKITLPIIKKAEKRTLGEAVTFVIKSF